MKELEKWIIKSMKRISLYERKKRERRILMNKVRVGGMFGGGGGILGGLMESMGDTSKGKKNKKTSTTAKQSMLGSSNNMLLGALISNDNVDMYQKY